MNMFLSTQGVRDDVDVYDDVVVPQPVTCTADNAHLSSENVTYQNILIIGEEEDIVSELWIAARLIYYDTLYTLRMPIHTLIQKSFDTTLQLSYSEYENIENHKNTWTETFPGAQDTELLDSSITLLRHGTDTAW